MNRQKMVCLVVIVLLVVSLGFVVAQPVVTQGQEYLFSMTFLAPTCNPVRVQHAQLIQYELHKIGINSKFLLVGWDVLIPRLFEPAGPLALSYADGGFDMASLRWSGGLLPRTQFWLFHSNFTPDPNYFGVQNTTLDAMLELTVNITDIALRKQYIENAWMELTWHHQAEIVLYQVENTVYMRDNVRGYSNNIRVPGPLGIAEMYFEDGKSAGHGQFNEFIMASTTRPKEYNDLIENSWYNQLAVAPLNHGMVERNPDFNFVPVLLTTLPYPVAVTNNHTGILSPIDPNTATVWEIELRDDVFWHEGYGYTIAADENTLRVDADDVLFTFDLILNENGPNPCVARPKWQRLLGNDTSLAVIKKDRHHVQFHLQTFDADLMVHFGQYLLPKHILKLGTVRADGSVAPSGYNTWTSDDWNVGARTAPYTGPAVIGNGPYILEGEDPITQTVTETKNPYWHLASCPAYANMFDKYIYTWITSKDAALTALEHAKIDLMDPQFHAMRDYPSMVNKSGIVAKKVLDWGCQTVGINTAHGEGGLTDYRVRLAISHACPRQEMVDRLLGGLGQTTFMHFPKQHPFYPVNVPPITYNLTRALDYMEQAGYDVSSFRPDSESSSNTLFGFNNFSLATLATIGLEVGVICLLVGLIIKKRLNPSKKP